MKELTRYPAYTDSGVVWAPQLPVGWRQTRLQRIASIYAGGTPDRTNLDFWTDGDIPWLNSGSVNDGVIMEPSELITKSAATGSSTRWAHSGSVLVALAGQGKTKGLAARLEISSTFNQSMAAIVPNPDLVDYRYLQLWLGANYQSIRNLAGGDLRDGLNLQHIGSIQLPLPPQSEQCAIADFLDRETAEIDAFIADQEELIGFLVERRAATIDRRVWNGLDPEVPVGPVGVDPVPDAPIHWERLRNKNILRERADLSEFGDEELLTVSHITGVTRRSEKVVTMIEAESHEGYRLVHSGDLVINTMWAWMGALGTAKEDGMVSPAYGVYAPSRTNYHPAYFDFLYRSRPYISAMTRYSRGLWTSRLRLYPDVFLSLPVSVPPMNEQIEIAKSLAHETSEIDAAIADAREAIDLSQERRAALISAAVTGKIDVRGF